MNPESIKLTDELAEKIKAVFSSEFQASMKEAGEKTGTFKIIISTNDVDRHGEIVDQSGLDVENYLTNPVVLWAHDHTQLPIAVADKVYRQKEGNKDMTIAEGRFAGHEFAQEVRLMYEVGMIKTASIGFIPKEFEGNTIKVSELIEFSFVPVPANPYAISLLAENAEKISIKSLAELFAKGLMIKETEQPKNNEEEEENEEEKSEKEQIATLEAKITSLETEIGDFKSGRVLSKSNENKIKAAVIALEEVLSSLPEEEGHAPEGKKGEEEEEIKKGEEFLKLRRGVQQLATLASDVLHEAAQDAKKYY